MKRRTVLSGVAASVATGLAGCLGTGPAPGGDENDQTDDTPNDDGTRSGDGTTTDDGSGGSGGDGSGSDGAGDGNDGGSGSETTTASATPSVEESSLSVSSANCGTGKNAASIAVEATSNSTDSPAAIVSVTGTIRGSDQCHTAQLKAATYHESADTLAVAVASYVPDDKSDSMCGQCLVDIEYEANVEVGGSVPGTIAVTHDGERIAEKSSGAN